MMAQCDSTLSTGEYITVSCKKRKWFINYSNSKYYQKLFKINGKKNCLKNENMPTVLLQATNM